MQIRSGQGVLIFILCYALSNLTLAANTQNNGLITGIYLTQYSLENTAFLHYLIQHAKAAKIHTFIVDLEKPSKRYTININILKNSGIKYVARIVMFPYGGTPKQINNPDY